ncbi:MULTISPECIES: FAD-dependent oxidoreductase [Myxococcaceae]|uniref:FAD-dependent oxidoreductase n=1 Tax=Myxococcaceae TaxID=31 RepID=UPI00188E86D6|nr:FAD-dependent oxidoreductase [Simulacricoccus sp. 17bor-14]
MKRLVLLGPGHPHLLLLAHLARARPSGVEVVLVSQGPAQLYSGMLSGCLAGMYPPAALQVDLPALARAAGARLEQSGAQGLEASARRVRLGDGRVLDYDVASVDVGSAPAHDEVPGVHALAVPLKPLAGALTRLRRLSAGPLLVVGAGAAGVELALCLQARAQVPTALVERGPCALPEQSARAQRLAARVLARRGIAVHAGESVAALEPGEEGLQRARLGSGRTLPFATCVWATGPRPHPLLASCGAALDAQGYLAVHDTLESTSHPGLFAAGDCAGFVSGQHVPRAGVYAVREAPVLIHNVSARLTGTEVLRRYRAQSGYLALLNAGDGTALGAWRGWAAEGRVLLRLKDRIDRRFMARFPRRSSD